MHLTQYLMTHIPTLGLNRKSQNTSRPVLIGQFIPFTARLRETWNPNSEYMSNSGN